MAAMVDLQFSKDTYNKLCGAKNQEEFQSIVDAMSKKDRKRFGPTTFCPPASTKLPSPLVTAARHQQLEVLRYLLETFPFIDINAKCYFMAMEDDCKWKLSQVTITPLFAAYEYMGANYFASNTSLYDGVRYLVDKGADVNIENGEGQTLLLLLASDLGTSHIHISSQDLCKPLPDYQIATVPGGNVCTHKSTMKLLIENGADINKADQYGKTLWECPQFALEVGADIYHCNAEGLTPLHVAFKSSSKAAKFLLDSGPSPVLSGGLLPVVSSTHPDYIPCPLYLAAAYGRKSVVDICLERKCPPISVVDAYLLLGISQKLIPVYVKSDEEANQKLRNFWNTGLKYLHQNHVEIPYLPPRPEYDYQVEIKSVEELDAVWDTDEFVKRGLLIQCALIAERCLGSNNLCYAEALTMLGDKLINNMSFADGE